MTNYIKKQKGFTLIELLVVVSILGVIASSMFVAMNTIRSKGRDAKRISDFHQVFRALEFYYDKHNTYPVTAGFDGYENWNTMVNALVADKLLAASDAEIYHKLALVPVAHAQSNLYQDPYFGVSDGFGYEYLYGGEDGKSYRMRVRLENPDHPALKQGVSGRFRGTVGAEACDKGLGFYCLDGGGYGYIYEMPF